MPAGVHLAVVDPGVGSERRPVALRSGDGRLFVGPDNGLLLVAADRLGGVAEAVELVDPAYRLERVAHTFHGRDIFAPAAAHLAAGVELEKLGPSVDPGSARPPRASRGRGRDAQDPGDGPERRPLREHPAQPVDRRSRARGDRARDDGRARGRVRALLRGGCPDVRRGPARRHRPVRGRVLDRSLSPSTTGTPPRCSAPRRARRSCSPGRTGDARGAPVRGRSSARAGGDARRRCPAGPLAALPPPSAGTVRPSRARVGGHRRPGGARAALGRPRPPRRGALLGPRRRHRDRQGGPPGRGALPRRARRRRRPLAGDGGRGPEAPPAGARRPDPLRGRRLRAAPRSWTEPSTS